jgi:hypothetical protein
VTLNEQHETQIVRKDLYLWLNDSEGAALLLLSESTKFAGVSAVDGTCDLMNSRCLENEPGD